MENYLKAIYELEERGERVTTSKLADRLAVASPSVTAMLKRLHSQTRPFVEHTPHRGVVLTGEGRQRALAVIRRHRLLETFFCEVLGFTWDEVHEEAERLQHSISERLEQRIAEYLGHPATDPHGDPIPSKDGQIAESAYVTLSDVEPGSVVRVSRVSDEQSEVLRYLSSLGIEPGVTLTLVEKAPFDGPYLVRLGGTEGAQTAPHGIGPGVADMVMVEVLQG